MEITITETCKAKVVFNNIAVNEKLWRKWKGRKAVEGWTARRQPWTSYDHVTRTRMATGRITFFCKDRAMVGNMTPERIEELKTMMYLLKEQ
jgi:hypothetical protein